MVRSCQLLAQPLKLEDYPLSAVHDCLCNIVAVFYTPQILEEKMEV
jgi:hypothetical protein